MKTVVINTLSEDARELLTEAEPVGCLVMEDENGRPRSRVYAYAEPTEAEHQAAWERMQNFRKSEQLSFDEKDVSNDDLDRLV